MMSPSSFIPETAKYLKLRKKCEINTNRKYGLCDLYSFCIYFVFILYFLCIHLVFTIILIHNHLAPTPWRTGAIFYATPYVLIFKKVQILEGQHPKNTGFQFFVWVVFSGQRPFEIQRTKNSEIKRFYIFFAQKRCLFYGY